MTAREDIQKLGRQINQSIIGQENMVERLLLGRRTEAAVCQELSSGVTIA